MNNDKIPVTRPFLPPLDEVYSFLEDIWERKWLTNKGRYHQLFEEELAGFLGVPHISLFVNGTLALITALRAIGLTGEVITSPYSFVATTHALWWNGLKPVFADIDPEYGNLDPEKVEAAITPQTTAILPVHVYGNPCRTEKLQKIADSNGLHLIYDAAHAFGVKESGRSILTCGDLSILSFHATKVFTTFEGGAIICPDARTKKHLGYLKNFGFAGETTVVGPGINAKMNEFQAAIGLLQLKYFDEAVNKRRQITLRYQHLLSDIKGVSFIRHAQKVDYNYAYFPIFINAPEYGRSRDELYEHLKTCNYYGRRYFFPLITSFPTYEALPSARPDNLPVAHQMAEQVLCLPLYPDLDMHHVENIADIIHAFKQ